MKNAMMRKCMMTMAICLGLMGSCTGVHAEVESKSADSIPFLDELYDGLTAEEITNDDGYKGIVYADFGSTENVVEAIQDYIDELEDYGYSLIKADDGENVTYHIYYLDCDDSEMEEISYRGNTCVIAIEGFSNDSLYNVHKIKVYYSPSIKNTPENDADIENDSTDGGYDISTNDDHKSKSYTISCPRCSDGTKTCSACNGRGGKYVYSSVPNYSGSLSGSKSGSTWENCSKCGGSGRVSCTYCGGSGYIDVN